MEFYTLAKLKVLNTNCSKILDLNSKFKQTGFEIKFWSYLLENVCTTQFESTSYVKWNDVERIHYLCTLLIPWNHQKIKEKKFQNSILDVWQDSEYANEYGCKILAIYYWWALWSIEINGCIGTKIFTSSLLPVSSVWFFKHQDSFFFIFFIILYHSCYRYCYCQGCCVFLASTLNFFCFIGNAVSLSSTSHHQRLI